MNLIRREDADHIGTPIGGQEKTDAFGCTFIYAYAIGAKLINTPYPLLHGAFGVAAGAIAASGVLCKCMVADKAVASGAYGWFAKKGPHDVVVTAAGTCTDGDAIIIHTDGKPVSDSAANIADYEPNTWAVALEAKGTATAVTIKCYIMDREATWT
ncbi:hypothetical protein LCGC14_1067990 [marine sediment metagenome]|uniref:Uncharacterized protein n=1 Tax=marine sediment metagenome TaxID=412755 RepID=A0A0F9MP10_9ZZZZ